MSKMPAPKIQAALLRQAGLDRSVIEYLREKGEPFTVPRFCELMAQALRGAK